MKLPINKFSWAALLWFLWGIYSLVLRESSHEPPPFPNFDKVAHFGLFFAQIWLFARAFIEEKLSIPYVKLMIFAFSYAVLSEWAQATFTLTRQGSVADGVADMLGALVALWLARKLVSNKNMLMIRSSEGEKEN